MFHRIISRKTSLEEKRGDYILDLEEVSEGLQRNIDDHPGKASEVIIIKEELQARIKLVSSRKTLQPSASDWKLTHVSLVLL